MSSTLAPGRFGEFITVERRNRLIEIVYDRGDGLNALSIQGMTELKDVALALADDTESSVIVLSGQGVFSAGADLKDPDRLDRDSATLLEQRTALKLGPDMCQAWADLEQVTIAAVEGFCIGGGLALVAACDHRVASEDGHFRLPEIPLGMNMSWRSIPRLVALIGPSRAKQLIMLGQKVDAPTALDWGLIDSMTPRGGALASAIELADAYAALPPIALRMTKQAIDVSAQPLGFASSFMDRDQFLLATQSEDQTEAIQSFLQKRPPKFSGN
ncbi:MAG: enoyl-CoA hydratase/isomerase family protein [Pseudomonadota bacterium]